MATRRLRVSHSGTATGGQKLRVSTAYSQRSLTVRSTPSRGGRNYNPQRNNATVTSGPMKIRDYRGTRVVKPKAKRQTKKSHHFLWF